MNLQEATEIASRTGNTDHVGAHWNRTRVALLHDVICDFLEETPEGVREITRFQFLGAQAFLRIDLDGMPK